jgi:ABC-type spermidine/putrescine transport system permease subunit II
LTVIVLLVVVFLGLPSVYVVMWSLFGTSSVGQLGAFSLRWYGGVLGNRDWLTSITYSLVLAGASASISLLCAVLYFYYGLWFKRTYQTIGYLMLSGPLLFPLIVYGLSLRMTFNASGTPEWVALLLGHTALAFPIQYLLLESYNEAVRLEWVWSAATMGGSHREILWKTLIPNMAGPLFLAFGMGFLFSFDEIVVATFVIDSALATVPKRLWDSINRSMDPVPAVIGTLMLGVTIALIIIYASIAAAAKKRSQE